MRQSNGRTSASRVGVALNVPNTKARKESLVRTISATLLFLALSMSYSASADTCFAQHLSDHSWCYVDGGSGYCEVIPIYSISCTGSYDVYDRYPDVAPLPDPGAPGSSTNPYELDPTMLVVERVTDANPSDLHVWVAADPILATFDLILAGTTYGSAWGTGNVTIGGLPASAFQSSNAGIAVRGCTSDGTRCAAAQTLTSVTPGYKSKSQSVTGSFLNIGLKVFDRSTIAWFKQRTYDVPSGPGNTRVTLDEIATFFTWKTGGPDYFTHASPTETIRYSVQGWTLESGTCQLFSYVEPPWMHEMYAEGTQTSKQRCKLEPLIGATADFEAEITRINLWGNEGMYLNTLVINSTMLVSIP
ncbi:MAG TPA: hypothetical protein VF701_19035 [Thermoanaerobaculia bacterium]